MKKQLILAGAAATTLCAAARAQLVIGHDDTTVGAPNAWHVDLTTGTSTVLWNNSEVWAMAADDAGGKIYAADGTPLTVWTYGSGPTVTSLGNTLSSVDAASLLFTSLCFDSATGTLYGGRSSNSTNNPEGIYTINVSVSPPIGTLFFNPMTTLYDWAGLGIDPATGKFYMTSDTAPTGVGAGLFVIDTVAATITKLSAYPGGETDVDGAEVGGGKVWLITDDLGDPIYSWDIAAGAYDVPTHNLPFLTTELFSGAGWAPNLFGTPGPVNYCTAGTTTNGCVATMSASGNPSVSMASPCLITVTNVEGQKNGIVFYGLAANNVPWAVGSNSFLCVKTPTQRTGTQVSGGTVNACDGTLVLDWDAFQTANPGALGQPWSAGDKAYVQAWFRDPPAIKTTNLSDGLEMTYVP